MSAAPRTDAVATRMAALVAPVVEAAGYDLEELAVTPAGRRSIVRVVVDRDAGVTLDDVAEVSRAVSAALDDLDGEFGSAPYVLEVTSPGVDRPLTLPRHWRRNVGRLVDVAAGPEAKREKLTGRVLRVEDDGVVLAVEKGGAKKGQVRKAVGERTLAWAELGEARVQVEFTRPAGHRDAALVHLGDDSDDSSDDGTGELDDELDGEIDDDDLLDEQDDEQQTAATPPADAGGGPGRPGSSRAPRGPRQRRGGTQ